MKRRGVAKTVLALLSLLLLSVCLPPVASASREEALAQLDEADRVHCEYQPFDCARQLWPDEFANVWGVGSFPGPGSPDSEEHFAFTSGAEEKVAFLRELFPDFGAKFVAHTFEYSEKYLYALQARVVDDFAKLRSGELTAPHDSFEYGWVGLYGQENRLRVPMLPYPPAFEAWALERWGPAVILEANPGLIPWPGTEMPGRTYPYHPETEEPDDPASESGPGASGPKAMSAKLKADRRTVRRCRKAAKGRSAKHRRFSKSKKCKRARQAVKRAGA